MASGAFTSDAEAIAAVSDYLEGTGEFETNNLESLSQQTEETAPNPPTQQEEVQTEEPATETEEQEEELQAEEEQEQEQDDDLISSLDAVAKHFQVETDEFLANIEVEDPFGNPVAIGDALESWRGTEKTKATYRDELQTEFNTKQAEAETAAQSAVQKMAAMTQAMVDDFGRRFNQDSMDNLRHTNPEGYADAVDERQRIQAIIEGSIDQLGAEADRQQAIHQEKYQEHLAKEQEHLIQKKPEWANAEVRTEALRKHHAYLTGMGFNAQEIAAISDHRMVLAVEDAIRGRQIRKETGSKKLEELRRRGLKRPSAPAGLSPQQRRDPENPESKAHRTARARLKQSGGIDDAARAIESLLQE